MVAAYLNNINKTLKVENKIDPERLEYIIY